MSTPSVLLIDDDPLALELVAGLVKQAFRLAKVSTLSAASHALHACRQNKVDCAIVDYDLPGRNGIDVAKTLRKKYPYLPIILCTGTGDEALVARALTSGVSDYIPKTKLSVESVGRAIRNSISNSAQLKLIDEQRRELEDFAFALSHDFKQPVRQLMVFTTMIEDAIAKGDFAETGRHLQFLHGAAGRLDALVDVMSQYTLLNKPPALGDVDLNLTLEGLRSSLGRYLEETRGQIIAGPAPVIRGNHALMAQVLQNLIVNGLKYNTNEAPTVRVKTTISGANCIIQVADNGIGIETEYLDEVFKPLVRLHNNTEYAGTGLGLTLARKAVFAQGGSIWCKSEVGVGSEFFVRVPLAGKASDRSPRAMPELEKVSIH